MPQILVPTTLPALTKLEVTDVSVPVVLMVVLVKLTSTTVRHTVATTMEPALMALTATLASANLGLMELTARTTSMNVF